MRTLTGDLKISLLENSEPETCLRSTGGRGSYRHVQASQWSDTRMAFRRKMNQSLEGKARWPGRTGPASLLQTSILGPPSSRMLPWAPAGGCYGRMQVCRVRRRTRRGFLFRGYLLSICSAHSLCPAVQTLPHDLWEPQPQPVTCDRPRPLLEGVNSHDPFQYPRAFCVTL